MQVENPIFKQFTFSITSQYFPLTYEQIITSMEGEPPEKCNFKLVFDLKPEDLRWTGLCRCTGRSVPMCRPCRNGASTRTDWEINSLIRDIKERFQWRFLNMINDIKTFFSACKGFTNFLSSSFVLNRCFQVQKKSNILSLDLGRIFERIMIKYEGNSLSQAGKRCWLRRSEIYQHVRMPTSSGSIFPDFADSSIRGKLLALSMSMKMLFQLVSLHHLYENCRGKMHLMQNIAQYICRLFVAKQMQKCM